MKRALLLVVALVGCRDGSSRGAPAPAAGQTPASLSVSSSAFASDATIPNDHTCHGIDQSPDLSWTAVPTTARSIAIVVDDPDAPSGPFTHWIAWNIKPEARMLGAAANGGMQGGVSGTNDFGHVGYNGPCPPKGKVHHYRFTVYGLDETLKLTPSDTRSDLDAAMNSHIVAQ